MGRRDYHRIGAQISEHFNSEHEQAVILKRPKDVAKAPGALLLCFIESGEYVPMLLDQGTVDWINFVFNEHKS